MAMPCEMPVGVGGFISFHFLRQQKISQWSKAIISHRTAGANIREANYAHGKADFIAKLQIALKECYETEYWLELFVKSDILNRETAVDLYNQCGTIRRILISSINTAKETVK